MWSTLLLTTFPPLLAKPCPTPRIAAAPNAVPLVFVQVVATAPAEVVQSPVKAGILAAASVPALRSEALPDVATAAGVDPLILATVGPGELPLRSPLAAP